jgi:hypothetical protein
MRLIFLDIDGVFNCQIFYERTPPSIDYDESDKELAYKAYYKSQLCPFRIEMFNELCKTIDAKVVISSTWRHMGLTKLTKILSENGCTFEIVGSTPSLNSDSVRGNEIDKWIKEHEDLTGKQYFDYTDYAIIDDDSDMLYSQRNNLFLTDNYSGLTPNTCYKIKRFFGLPTFP